MFLDSVSPVRHPYTSDRVSNLERLSRDSAKPISGDGYGPVVMDSFTLLSSDYPTLLPGWWVALQAGRYSLGDHSIFPVAPP